MGKNSSHLKSSEVMDRWQCNAATLTHIINTEKLSFEVDKKPLHNMDINSWRVLCGGKVSESDLALIYFKKSVIEAYEKLHPEIRPQAIPTGKQPALKQNTFKKTGDQWTLQYAGMDVAVSLNNQKGFAYISHLLLNPGKDFPALDLYDAVFGIRCITKDKKDIQSGHKFQNEREYQSDADSRTEHFKCESSLKVKLEIYKLEQRYEEESQDQYKLLEAQDTLKEINELKEKLQSWSTPERKMQNSIRMAIVRAMEKIKHIVGNKSPLYLHLKNHLPLQWPMQYQPANPIDWET